MKSDTPEAENESRWLRRRELLRCMVAGTAMVSLEATVPRLLQSAAVDATDDQKVLVVIEMAGGNDGLNTVVPHRHDVYRSSRPTLGISTDSVLPINDELGFHPSLRGFADLLDQGALAVVQGVGYPDPNRSHFESMDIWHTCQRKDVARSEGWLGRYVTTVAGGMDGDPPGLHLGGEEQPLALASRETPVPSLQSLEQFRLVEGSAEQLSKTVLELTASESAADDDLLKFVQSSTSTALAASEQISRIGDRYQPVNPYPQTSLGRKLETVAKLIAAGLDTRIYYVRVTGFDTHANQPDVHAALLREVGDAVSAFTQDLSAAGQGERVLSVCFSEFGRRVSENASDGTDHGTAGPMFVAGSRVASGLIGEHPSLERLDRGDLIHHTDFRQVYASLLERWLSAPSEPLLKGRYQPIDLLT